LVLEILIVFFHHLLHLHQKLHHSSTKPRYKKNRKHKKTCYQHNERNKKMNAERFDEDEEDDEKR